MRQFHKKGREQAAGSGRQINHPNGIMQPGDPSNEGTADTVSFVTASSMDAAVTQRDTFQIPIRGDTHFIENNPAPADIPQGENWIGFLDSASHKQRSYVKLRMAPRQPLSSVRPGPRPPLPGSQMDSSSLKLVQFCKCFSHFNHLSFR
jgi:hypothetical protein